MQNNQNIIAYENLVDVSLSKIASYERAVIFSSALTDIRIIITILESLKIPYKVIEMSMRNVHNREAYVDLCTLTGWYLLPQIFIDNEFVGGVDEFLQHHVIAPNIKRLANPAMIAMTVTALLKDNIAKQSINSGENQ